MNSYKITLATQGYDSHTEVWSGYDEQVAIAQAFLYHAQQGVREIKVLEIQQV